MGLLLQKTKIYWKASTVLQHDMYMYSTILRMGCACPSTAKSNFTFIRSWNASSYTTTLLQLSGGSGIKVYLFSYRKDGLKELVSIQYTQVTGQRVFPQQCNLYQGGVHTSLGVWNTRVSWELRNLIPRIPPREHFKAFPWNEGRKIPIEKSWHCQLLSWHQPSVPTSQKSGCVLLSLM